MKYIDREKGRWSGGGHPCKRGQGDGESNPEGVQGCASRTHSSFLGRGETLQKIRPEQSAGTVAAVKKVGFH